MNSKTMCDTKEIKQFPTEFNEEEFIEFFKETFGADFSPPEDFGDNIRIPDPDPAFDPIPTFNERLVASVGKLWKGQ